MESPRRDADLLVIHANELLTARSAPGGARGSWPPLELIADGALAIRRGRIVAVGRSDGLLKQFAGTPVIDAGDRLVTPGLIDVHTHLMHAGSRHEEWQSSLRGQPSNDPLATGIRSTVDRTTAASDEALLTTAHRDLDVMLAHGTTTVEAKTGYGLFPSEELRLLRLTASLRHPIDVVPTFLAAHVLPAEYRDRRNDYVRSVIESLSAARRYAEYCDLACDPSCFTEAECREMAAAATALGYRLRIHGDQTGPARAAQLAVELDAASVDHLDCVDAAGIAALAGGRTVAVLVPGVTHHLIELVPRMGPHGPTAPAKPWLPETVRRLVDAGACVALATDYNPGSSPMPSMQVAMQLGARLFGLDYAEAWLMSTINAARALDRDTDRGSLEPRKRADVLIWDVPEHGMAIHRFGVNLVRTVLKDGIVVVDDGRRVARTEYQLAQC